jgi:hypothetical protein
MSDTTPAAQSSDFFNVLNRDVRNLIYGYMTLAPIRNNQSKDWMGFAASCRKARQEIKEEGVRHLWQDVKDLQAEFEKTGMSYDCRDRYRQLPTLLGWRS